MKCVDCGKETAVGYEYDERYPLCRTCAKKRELHDERDDEDSYIEEDFNYDADRED